MTRATVVIPCLDACETIGEQLDALAAQEWDEPWEVVVVDNGSADGTTELVASYADKLPSLRLLVTTEEKSSPYARNVGCRAAEGELLLFCDADDVVADGWLAATANALRDHPIVASRQELDRLNPDWLVRSRDAVLTHGLQRWPHPPHFLHAATCGLGVRREVYDALDGFDESVVALPDAEFCFRAQLAGYELTFVPESLVHYRYRGSFRSIFKQARGYSRDEALLQQRYRAGGGPIQRFVSWPMQGWRPIAGTLLKLRDRSERARLAWMLGWLVGRYEGSFRYRVLAI